MEEKLEAQDHDRSESDKEKMAEDQHRDLEMGRVGSESEASDDTANEDLGPDLTQVATGNSVPASVLSHSASGGTVDRAPTGPKNKSIDEEGKIVVNWISRTDPENPKNWARKKKIFNVVVISSMTFLCPLCSAMFVLPQKPESLLTSSLLGCPRSCQTFIRPRRWLHFQCRCFFWVSGLVH
jgi:hypothetical protein